MILNGARIISPIDNIDEVLDIKIENSVIVEIAQNIEGEGIDFSGMIISSGLVDMHCHLREPGFEYKETIQTGIEAALQGGFTAICPMANTNPVVDNAETLKYTTDKAKRIGFYPICAVTKWLQGQELTDFDALKHNGAIAFSDDGRPLANLEILSKALKTGELIISHAEDLELLGNPLCESVAVAKELEILKKIGGRLHFAHISTKKSIELIRKAKLEGLNVTCETAPHYFSLTTDDETEDGRFKMNPPLAAQADLIAVIEGLKDGTIDCIATDHAPHSLEEKTKPFAESPSGVVGFETALGLSLKLVEDGHLTINQVIEKLSVNPAKILGLKNHGQIKIGEVANLTIIDPNITYKVKAEEFKTKCKITLFEGMELKGKAIWVVVNGELIETGKVKCGK